MGRSSSNVFRRFRPAAAGAQALTGQTSGSSTDTGDLVVAHALDATSAGTSTTSGSVTVAHSLTATSAGISATSGDVVVAHSLTATSAGTSTDAGDVVVAHSLDVTDAGTSTSSGDVLVAHTLVATSVGTSTTAGAASIAVALTGQSDGSAVTTGDFAGSVSLVGQSDGSAATSGDLDVTAPDVVDLTGQSNGVATTSGDLTVAGLGGGYVYSPFGREDRKTRRRGQLVALTGESLDENSRARGALRPTLELAATSDGTSDSGASLTVDVQAGAVSESGDATTSGVLGFLVPLTGSSRGVGRTAAFGLTLVTPSFPDVPPNRGQRQDEELAAFMLLAAS